MRRLWVALSLVFAFAVAGQSSRGTPEMSFEGESVDAMIAAFMKEHAVDGMSVAIVQAPYITRATGYGMGDRERRTLVSHNTIFDIAQMKNAFTAVATLQLVESGELTLDDELRAKLADSSRYTELETLIAQTSGGSYEDFVREHQFERLGLKQTFFASAISSRREELRPGEKHRGFLTKAALIDPTEPATGHRGEDIVAPRPTAIYSSPTDVSIWDIGLAGEILIKSAELRRVLYAPPASSPWSFPGHEGLMIVTGSANGFSSLLSRFTKSDELVCVTLLANREGLDLTQLARRIAGAHNTKLGPPARAKGMRVQESPYSVEETKARVARTLPQAQVWEEGGDVWVAVANPRDAKQRAEIDAALLAATSPAP